MFPNCFPQWLKSLGGAFLHFSLASTIRLFFFIQTSKRSYYYIRQTDAEMTIVQLPDEKTHLSKATCKWVAIINDVNSLSPWETAETPHLSKLSL